MSCFVTVRRFRPASQNPHCFPGRSAATIRGPGPPAPPIGSTLVPGSPSGRPGRQRREVADRVRSGRERASGAVRSPLQVTATHRNTGKHGSPEKNWWADRSVYCPARCRTSGRRAGEKCGFPPFRRRRARIRLRRPARGYRIFCRIISISENNLHSGHRIPVNFSNGIDRSSGVQMAFLRFIEPTSCFRKIFSRKMAKKSEILCQKTAHFNPDSPPRSRSARLCPAGRAGKPRRSTSPAGPRPASPSSRSWGRCPAAPPRPRRAPRSGRRRRCARRR